MDVEEKKEKEVLEEDSCTKRGVSMDKEEKDWRG